MKQYFVRFKEQQKEVEQIKNKMNKLKERLT